MQVSPGASQMWKGCVPFGWASGRAVASLNCALVEREKRLVYLCSYLVGGIAAFRSVSSGRARMVAPKLTVVAATGLSRSVGIHDVGQLRASLRSNGMN